MRVSIVEDDQVTRDSLAALIGWDAELTCMHTYGSAEQALREAPAELPDVLLVDINLPGQSGIECVRQLKTAHPKLQVLMLTTYDDTENIFDSLRAGASGYLLKRTPASEIIASIKEVHQGGSPMSAHIARKVVTFFHAEKARSINSLVQSLSAREHEILTQLARGLQYKEIAHELGISTSTVRAHLHTIYGKLHVQSRTEAVVKFLQEQ